MNNVVLMGRLTDEPDKRYTQGNEPMAVTRYRLAVDRRGKDAGTDFIPVITFGKAAEFAGDYFHKGMRVCISGRIQTGSYTNREGKKVYTTDVIADEQEFADSKREASETQMGPQTEDGFIPVPEDIQEELPFD